MKIAFALICGVSLGYLLFDLVTGQWASALTMLCVLAATALCGYVQNKATRELKKAIALNAATYALAIHCAVAERVTEGEDHDHASTQP